MLVQALYNVVDSIFVARLSMDALTAVTLAFPMQNLMIALGAGTGVGVNALLSRSLGEKKQDRADAAACNGVFLAGCSAVLFFLIGAVASGPFIRTQTADAQIAAYGTTYLSIVAMCSVGLFFQVMLERLLQSTGRTFYSMISQMTGAIINIILDPVMIFGLLGCPAFGVAGAAYATVIGQCVAAVTGLFLNLRKNDDVHLRMAHILRPDKEVIGQIFFVGVPSILMMSIGSLMTYLLNRILGSFGAVTGAVAIAVFGAYFKLQSFFFMPVFGLNNGLIPVLAFNYGARKKERMKEALTFSLMLAIAVMATGTVVMELFPAGLLSLFADEGTNPDNYRAMMEMGIPALRRIAIHFPIAALCIIMGSIFQALSKSYYSLVISIMRQLVALIPAAYLLARTGDVGNVWWAFLIAETVSLVFSLVFFRRVYKTTVEVMPDSVST
ncbi:MAG: MATE family efflux transporter [Lachnospiraceae bacterium]|nr:MATE family efflux transporter [Lachnospiraceae bacterium]